MTEKKKSTDKQKQEQEELSMDELDKVSGGVARTSLGITSADDWESPLKSSTTLKTSR